MIIIAGHLIVEPEHRTGYVEVFRDLVARCRDVDGCLEVAITADSVDPGRINNLVEVGAAGSVGVACRRNPHSSSSTHDELASAT